MIEILIIIGMLFLVLDFFFIYVYSQDMWKQQIKEIQNGTEAAFRPLMAIAVYIIMIAATYGLVVQPALKYSWSFPEVLFKGALLGIAMYGVFDGTNYVIFKDYKMKTLLQDAIYGTIATMTIGAVAWGYARPKNKK